MNPEFSTEFHKVFDVRRSSTEYELRDKSGTHLTDFKIWDGVSENQFGLMVGREDDHDEIHVPDAVKNFLTALNGDIDAIEDTGIVNFESKAEFEQAALGLNWETTPVSLK